MNKDKIIKDLKERNEKLSNQYRLRDIRCVHLEMENADLQQRIDKANDFIDIYTDGINLDAFDCLQLMYKIKEILGGKE